MQMSTQNTCQFNSQVNTVKVAENTTFQMINYHILKPNPQVTNFEEVKFCLRLLKSLNYSGILNSYTNSQQASLNRGFFQ